MVPKPDPALLAKLFHHLAKACIDVLTGAVGSLQARFMRRSILEVVLRFANSARSALAAECFVRTVNDAVEIRPGLIAYDQ